MAARRPKRYSGYVLRRQPRAPIQPASSPSRSRWRTRRCLTGWDRCGQALGRQTELERHLRLPDQAESAPAQTARDLLVEGRRRQPHPDEVEHACPEPGARSIGGYAEARAPGKEIELVDTKADFQAAYPYPVIGIFGKGWDDLKTLSDEFVTAAREKTTPERQVSFRTSMISLPTSRRTTGRGLPEFSASFGNEWDLYTASVTEVSARVRRAVEKLRSAEALIHSVSLQWPEFLNGRRAARDQAWMNLGIYWEHNWTADGSLHTRARSAPIGGARVAAGIEAYVDTLHADAAFALGGMIRTAGGEAPLLRVQSARLDAAGRRRHPLRERRTTSMSSIWPPGEEAPFQFVRSAGGDRIPSRPTGTCESMARTCRPRATRFSKSAMATGRQFARRRPLPATSSRTPSTSSRWRTAEPFRASSTRASRNTNSPAAGRTGAGT